MYVKNSVPEYLLRQYVYLPLVSRLMYKSSVERYTSAYASIRQHTSAYVSSKASKQRAVGLEVDVQVERGTRIIAFTVARVRARRYETTLLEPSGMPARSVSASV